MGITVNNQAKVNKNYRRKIRQEVYFLKKHLYGNFEYIENKTAFTCIDEYIRKLEGRVSYVLFVDPKDESMIRYKKELIKIRKEFDYDN